MRNPTVFSILFLILLIGCTSCSLISGDRKSADPTIQTDTPGSSLEAARHAIIDFFDALSRGDFRTAGKYLWSPSPLQHLFKDIDPGDAEALLERACIPNEKSICRFYCWKIMDVVSQEQISAERFAFTVKFEDENGNLLTGLDNVTPRPCEPPDCPRSKYPYVVRKVEEEYYVEGVPVFSSCWP